MLVNVNQQPLYQNPPHFGTLHAQSILELEDLIQRLPKIGNLHLPYFATKNSNRGLILRLPKIGNLHLPDFATKNVTWSFFTRSANSVLASLEPRRSTRN